MLTRLWLRSGLSTLNVWERRLQDTVVVAVQVWPSAEGQMRLAMKWDHLSPSAPAQGSCFACGRALCGFGLGLLASCAT